MDKIEIIETVKAAKDYLTSLKELENEVKIAEEQIENSAMQTEKSITESFSNLLNEVRKTLENRQKSLLQQIVKVKEKSLNPLRDCRKVIVKKIDNTENFINLGQNLINNSQKFDAVTFDKNTAALGSLPEVPQLKEVPCISYNFETITYKDIVDSCKAFGSVTSIAPVQISALTEKPGALLVEFECMEQDDKLTDIQEFRLQKALNTLSVHFQDCYIGPEYQYLVRDLQINESYLFRVCCKFEGSSSWSSWSIPQIGKTSIKSYSWCENPAYTVRNDNRIAKVNDDKLPILFSDGPQFHVGYSIEFTFLECDMKLNGTFIGLCLCNKMTSLEDLMSDSFVIEATGDVYVNGIKKNTKLPQISVGSKICFTCELLNETKILMNVECSDKQVTYDWFLSSDDKMFFLGKFNSTKWKIMVE